MKILIYGLSGAGKSTLAEKLSNTLNLPRLNGDEVRKLFNDWDFSEEGRLRQAVRMKDLAMQYSEGVIIDFVCPLDSMRAIVNAQVEILMDTITECKYNDTNKMFDKGSPDIIITSFDYDVNQIISRCQQYL